MQRYSLAIHRSSVRHSNQKTESVRFLEGSPTTDYGIALVSDPAGVPGTNMLSGGNHPAVGTPDFPGEMSKVKRPA
jgi:hypothetical protein